ncbi:hypothetical protein ES703_21421 [subsurface metagenome]
MPAYLPGDLELESVQVVLVLVQVELELVQVQVVLVQVEPEPVQVVLVLVQVELVQVVLVWNLCNQPLPIPRPTLKLILFLDHVP